MAQKYYSYKYMIDVPPYDKLPAVLEAFFTSYSDGDYTLESKDKYRQEYRRGNWTRTLMSLGMLTPGNLIKGQFTKWPIKVRLLTRPSPESFRIAIHYELHLPSGMKKLPAEVQASVDKHIRKELGSLANYLCECIESLAEPPAIQEQ